MCLLEIKADSKRKISSGLKTGLSDKWLSGANCCEQAPYEHQSLELRIEMQKALNQLHYDQPASARINSSLFGVADPGTVESVGLLPGSSPRTVQLSAKYAFRGTALMLTGL